MSQCSFDVRVKRGIVNKARDLALETNLFTANEDILTPKSKDGDNLTPIQMINDQFGEEVIKQEEELFRIDPSLSLVNQYVSSANAVAISRAIDLADTVDGIYGTLLKEDPHTVLKEIAHQSYGDGDTEFGDLQKNAKRIFGDEIVDIAQQLYPAESYEVDTPAIDYGLKAIAIIASNEGLKMFEKGQKNGWSIEKILTELQPKAQQELILNSKLNEPTQIVADLLVNYSYAVEINTATRLTTTVENPFDHTEPMNTDYYSNLIVPGGTNGSYIEANIETPMIVPSIQSHAQFKTDSTIGWMRADEKQNYQEKDIDNLIEIMKKSGILEVNCG